MTVQPAAAPASTARINRFCLDHGLRLADHPCISPDWCLDWPALRRRVAAEHAPMATMTLRQHHQASFAIAGGEVALVEDEAGDHAWVVRGAAARAELLADGAQIGPTAWAYPASWRNLLALRDLILAHDPASTIFPSTGGGLDRRSIGVGARFTTLHWPAVEWAMAHLGISLVANQNSIPRELVYDVDAMLDGRLMGVPFPFIGASVPEGHQGQSVEGMSHGAVLSKLKTGFHRRRIPWGFNADHQPIGGAFDAREDRLVEGSILASSITFDLSPELAVTPRRDDPAAWVAATIDPALTARVRSRVAACGIALDDGAFAALLAAVWPAVAKMRIRDRKYRAARERAFAAPQAHGYVRELSIDELPGLTTPATLATMLALCEALEMPVQYVAPAFGFQKNFPFADGAELERRVAAAWAVCRAFGVSIGFHSGSGKSADNYRCIGRITGGCLEIKTSGRYTYEMGRALAASPDAGDRALFAQWWTFTRDLALAGAFSADATEAGMARQFIQHALAHAGRPAEAFAEPAATRSALAALRPDPEHMFWFEYNFLFVLAAGGRAEKAALGDHSPAGYAQRARFYAISPAGRLAYLKLVASYLCFLTETTGLVPAERVTAARARLDRLASLDGFIADIAP